MEFLKVTEIVKDIPHISTNKAKLLYDFVKQNKFKNILELGFAHGKSTCYMAGAIDENEEGLITTIDRYSANEKKPNIYDLLEKVQLKQYVKPILCNTSYNWELMKIIEQQTDLGVCKPVFDFCFIDGAHTWEVDGLAFFLVDKLLKPGGWVLFDDLDWTYAGSPALKNTEFVQKLPEDEKDTPQVEKVFSLLVTQHVNFENFIIKDGWGWVQKKSFNKEADKGHNNIVNQIYLQQSIKQDIVSILRKIKNKVKV
jgi:predicted O-methyltransferase YrrM